MHADPARSAKDNIRSPRPDTCGDSEDFYCLKVLPLFLEKVIVHIINYDIKMKITSAEQTQKMSTNSSTEKSVQENPFLSFVVISCSLQNL